MEIYCCGCEEKVEARLTDGSEIYPHRNDLHELPFWRCAACGNYVGCHHKTKNRTAPLGCIPTPEIRKARQEIHKILDPLWQTRRFKRKELYQKISDVIGWKFHTSKTRSIEECREVYRVIRDISNSSALPSTLS